MASSVICRLGSPSNAGSAVSPERAEMIMSQQEDMQERRICIAAFDESLLGTPDWFLVCRRCSELDILSLISLPNPELAPRFSEIFLQRAAFDLAIHPPVMGCVPCLWLAWKKDVRAPLSPSRLYRTRTTKESVKQLALSSWFEYRPSLNEGEEPLQLGKKRRLSLDSSESNQRAGELVRCTEEQPPDLPAEGDVSWYIYFETMKDFVKRVPFNYLQNQTGKFYREHERFGMLSPNDGLSVVGESPNYELVSGWLDDCDSTHAKCKPFHSTSLQRIKLIDVHNLSLVSYPVSEHGPVDYLALSYVWGTATQPKVASLGKLPKELPKTIRDSMEVVRQLKKRYLWVDSICINQDDMQMKIEQISIMDAIYLGAFATIIALSGSSADDGLPRVPSSDKGVSQLCVEFGSGSTMMEIFPSLNEHLQKSKWASRGWTYQEGLLSRRRICFTEHEVLFRCNEMECCESYIKPLKAKSSSLEDPIVSVSQDAEGSTSRDIYGKLMNNYIHRDLTKQEDILAAVSGIFAYLQRSMFPEGFFYGLPSNDFRCSLLWSQPEYLYWDPQPPQYLSNLSELRRITSINMPSWSWSGWKLPFDIILPSLGVNPDFAEIGSPLAITTNKGARLIDISIPLSDLEIQETPSEPQMPAAKVARLLMNRYRQLLLKSSRSTRSGTAKFPPPDLSSDNNLLVEGILFQIHDSYIRLKGSGSIDFEENGPGLHMPCFFNVEYQGYNVKFPSRNHGRFFLLVHVAVETKAESMILHLLALEKTPKGFSRGGVARMELLADRFEDFWRVSDPSYRKFMLT